MRFKLDDPKNLTLDNIFRTLKKNEHQYIGIPEFDYFHKFPPRHNFEEFPEFLYYFSILDRFQILSWMLWFIGAYIVVILAIKALKKKDVKDLERKVDFQEKGSCFIKQETVMKQAKTN